MSRNRLPVRSPLAVVAIAGLVLSACSTTPASSAPAAASPSAANPSVAATAVPSAATLSVDLVFSGTKSLIAKGTAGQCGSGRNVTDGSRIFGFGATEADYPGLGPNGFYLSEDTHGLSYKWFIDSGLAYAAYFPGGATLSSDHKSITIDADLGGPAQPAEHLKGTISCP